MTYPTPTLPRRWRLLLPLSNAATAILEGAVRRRLEERGMQAGERRLAGMPVATYFIPGPAGVPPLALIHGLGASAMTWAQLIAALRGTAPIYALDLPGFGLSALAPDQEPLSFRRHAEVVTAWLEAVVGRPATLVGNSLGGWLTLRLALERPELMAAAVALNPAGILLEQDAWEQARAILRPQDCAGVLRFYEAMFGRVAAPLYLLAPAQHQRLWRRSIQGFLDVAEAPDFLGPGDLRRIVPPTTVVWGTRDTFMPAGSLDMLRDNLPGGRVVALPGCGHMPQIESPRQTAELVRQAIDTIRSLNAGI
jgi:pimeloyl-ACP methyl ester carboxylesterase